MKRDMDLIRAILLDVEGEGQVDLSAYTDEQLVYHSTLLIEADLVHGSAVTNAKGFPLHAVITTLTWTGHEFLDAARSKTTWNKVKGLAKSKGLAITLDVLGALVKQVALSQISS